MNLNFNLQLAENYKSASQISRVLTEDWAEHNLYCPICGKPRLARYGNNHPTGDFYCDACKSDFELKSKNGKFASTIADGEYNTMISRIISNRNPNFFFMSYVNYAVVNFVLVPNHFFTPSIIIKRKPLSANARRAGWTGCNINISTIPDTGKIFIVKDGVEIARKEVIAKYEQTKSLNTANIDSRGWLLDTLSCVERINETDFTLQEVYAFENEMKVKHPENNFIKDKLRQQLQFLRDKGFVEFTGRGRYRKI